jgi:energy-coupling factor transporter transmembrane protein EcfT
MLQVHLCFAFGAFCCHFIFASPLVSTFLCFAMLIFLFCCKTWIHLLCLFLFAYFGLEYIFFLAKLDHLFELDHITFYCVWLLLCNQKEGVQPKWHTNDIVNSKDPLSLNLQISSTCNFNTKLLTKYINEPPQYFGTRINRREIGIKLSFVA